MTFKIASNELKEIIVFCNMFFNQITSDRLFSAILISEVDIEPKASGYKGYW